MKRENDSFEDFEILIEQIKKANEVVEQTENIIQSVDFILDFNSGKLKMTYIKPEEV